MDNTSLYCWKCHKKTGELPMKIAFRAACIHCDSDLHVCKNCKYYCLGKPNDCLVPGTETIRDRERSNLCEEFAPKIETKTPPQKKKSFDDLFH